MRLSFIRYDIGVEFQQALTTSDLDGGDQRDLVLPSFDVGIKTGSSPSGRRIVFTRDANPDPVHWDPRGQRRHDRRRRQAPPQPHRLSRRPPDRVRVFVLSRRPVDRLPVAGQRDRPFRSLEDVARRNAPQAHLQPGRPTGTQYRLERRRSRMNRLSADDAPHVKSRTPSRAPIPSRSGGPNRDESAASQPAPRNAIQPGRPKGSPPYTSPTEASCCSSGSAAVPATRAHKARLGGAISPATTLRDSRTHHWWLRPA